MRKNVVTLILLGMMLFPTISAYSDSVYVGDYDLDVEYDSAVADDVFSLVVTITNDGDEGRNLSLEFDEDDPFEFVGDDYWDVFVESGASESRTFRIEVDDDADSKKYGLDFNLDDGDDDWDDELDIRVSNDCVDLSLGEIVSSPKKILPGQKDVELSVSVENDGDLAAENLVVKLILPEGFEKSGSYSDEVHVGDLGSGESKVLTFYFDVDDYLSEDGYTAELRFEYEEDGDDEVDSLDFGVDVFGIPQFEIVGIDVLSEGVYSGGSAQIKVGIRNVGGEVGEDVSLKVYERSDQPFSFDEKSVYVGTLGVGDVGYAVYDFDVERGASDIEYLLDFQVRSISGDDVIVDDLTGAISVSKKSFDFRNHLFAGILGLFVIFGLVFLVARRF